MEKPVVVYQQKFDATREECIGIIDEYLSGLANWFPDVSLRVEAVKKNLKEVWKGYLVRNQPWGIPDVEFGHVEIVRITSHLQKPVQVSVYCSRPDDIHLWKPLENLFDTKLPLSNGFPSLNEVPWMLIADRRDDRKILQLWYEGNTAAAISLETGLAERTIYDRLRLLRKQYGEEIIPKKRKNRSNS